MFVLAVKKTQTHCKTGGLPLHSKSENKIRHLVDQLVDNYKEESLLIKTDTNLRVNHETVIQLISQLQNLIFAGFFNQKTLKTDTLEYETGSILENVFFNFKIQISIALANDDSYTSSEKNAEDIVFSFLEKLPEIRKILATDVDAAYDGDPAATSTDEIILCYPGLYAIMVNRLAHELYLLGVPLIPRLMTEHAHSLTGIDIHPGASIGHHFFIDHGTGIVIGETTEIGNYVKIYQGVTLGALSTRGGRTLRETKRHPTIRDRVTIYSGASILGGETCIGEDVIIGANAFIVKSVPDRTRVSVHNPELQFRDAAQTRCHVLEQDQNWDI